MILSDT